YAGEEVGRVVGEMGRVGVGAGFRLWQRMPLGLRVLGWLYRLFLRVVFAHTPEPLPGWLGWREHRYRLLARVLFGLRSQDVNCPFRLYRREVFDRIPVQSDGDFANVEVLAKANFLGSLLTA